MNDLQLERLIRFDERSLKYSAGFRILELANRGWARSDIRALSRGQLEHLCRLSGEIVQLAVPVNTHIVYIDTIDSLHNVHMSPATAT